MVDIALILLLPALARGRARAWILLAHRVPASAWLARTPHALLPLLLVPVLFVALVAWVARTLHAGRVPLITRIVSAMEATEPARLEPDILRYTRRLTGVWAAVLSLLAALNLALALLAVPRGLLAGFGIAPRRGRSANGCGRGARTARPTA